MIKSFGILLFLTFVGSTITTVNVSTFNTVVASLNSTVIFDCDITGTSENHLIWKKRIPPDFKDPNHIVHSNTKTVNLDVNELSQRPQRHRRSKHSKQSFHLTNVELSDSGIYTCHSLKKDRAPLRSWTLIVINPEEISHNIYYDATVLQNQSVITVQEGDDLALTCLQPVISGDESKLARWNTGPPSKEINSFLHLHKLSDLQPELTIATRSLMINSVERSHFDIIYECIDDHDKSKIVTIDVNFPPTFTIRRSPAFGIPVVDGMKIALICEVEKKRTELESEPYWLKDDKPMKPSNISSTLVIDKVSVQDIGWYQCAINFEGELYTSIGYYLNILRQSTDVGRQIDIDNNTTTPDVTIKDRNLFDTSEMVRPVTFEDSSPLMTYPSCAGCCSDPSPEVDGSPPRINLASTELPDPGRIIVEVCSEPLPEKIFWVTPTQRVIRPGQETTDGFRASHITVINETCVTASLYFTSQSSQNEIAVYAKNIFGISDFEIISQGVVEFVSSEMSSCTSCSANVIIFFFAFLNILFHI